MFGGVIDMISGKNIKQLREKQGLQIKQLAEKAGIGAAYLSGVEKGDRNPTEEVLLNIAKSLDVPPYYLFLRDEDRTEDVQLLNRLNKVEKELNSIRNELIPQ